MSNNTSTDMTISDLSQSSIITKAVIIGISLTFGVILVLLITFFVVSHYRTNIIKGRFRNNTSTNYEMTSQRQNNRSPRESTFKFCVDPTSLIVIRKHIELAFPGFSTLSVKTTKAIPFNMPSFYFEMKILSKESNANICCGLATSHLPNSFLPGYGSNSVGYSSMDGQLYINGILTNFNPELKYGTDDVIGCGFFPRTKTVIFTRNGNKEYIFTYDSLIYEQDVLDLFPTIGSTGSSIVKINFGRTKFVYGEANRNAWGLRSASTLDALDLPAPPPTYQISDTNQSISNPSLSIYTPQLHTLSIDRRVSTDNQSAPPAY